MRNRFNATMVNAYEKKENGGCHHPTTNGVLYITKGDITMKFCQEEIKEIAAAIGGKDERHNKGGRLSETVGENKRLA